MLKVSFEKHPIAMLVVGASFPRVVTDGAVPPYFEDTGRVKLRVLFQGLRYALEAQVLGD